VFPLRPGILLTLLDYNTMHDGCCAAYLDAEGHLADL
jgi:hypothetical protein